MKTTDGLIALAAGVLAVVPLLAGRQVPPSAQPARPAESAPVKETPPGKPHVEIPDTDGETCLFCHEGLDKAQVVHAPVAARECTICHEFAGEGDAMTVNLAGVTPGSASGVLCRMCHDDQGTAASGPGGHSPAASDECVICHSPHGSDQRSLLLSPQAELCTMCHDDVAEQLKLANVHKPAAASCGMCHDPHGSGNPAKTRETVNPLCLACHLVGAAPPKEGTQAPSLFGRPVPDALAGLLSPGARVALDKLRLRHHPILGHPVSGPKDPRDETRPFTCVSCHSPHGTEGPKLKRFASNDPSAFCVECH